ncbi:DUF3572 domain-containing protein [Rhodospirillum rubrum]|uniref:DUF3572 domain-containing protein n=1 Tax=Rhodospirillum rubrum (strain ATCC 11170 / ATH 1.1.1 / DSM 467 / LMG 4362 / NCIMB 8255 / S1) TaxID=269796 RepID=Q2RUY5_RHORT|nr:DUF3572 domain-containing protein [Rhodospirillum rubrum]ABC22060.1 conserved hypothetical protein [Rhodospirillum rubrum ATCC 11170]AEO47772.1 hypothetical protein F11_06510 [Rhodospirillum rubrum F11]MBK5953643.1 hypothetical protein [Rhodospirillum rubrum]QXG81713.1 DUF3572 domain-containing protein [Rhodospirillum rubrum]HAP99637.1 DUF3572 domain-containing protein [Rhodospirillum rubrum]
MAPRSSLTPPDAAQALALRALTEIAGDDDLLGRFLVQTGCGPDALRRRITDPAFLGAVLDFILESDATVTRIALALDVPPGRLATARSLLPGATPEGSP